MLCDDRVLQECMQEQRVVTKMVNQWQLILFFRKMAVFDVVDTL